MSENLETNKHQKHKATHIQTDRYQLIDKLISAGNFPSFEFILNSIRKEIAGPKFSDSSLRRDIKYMQYGLNAPIEYDRTKNGYYYSSAYALPFNSLSIEELEKLALVKKLFNQFDTDGSIYNETANLISKLFPSTNALDFMKRIEFSKRSIPLFDKQVYNDIIKALRNNYLVDFYYNSKWEPNKKHRKVMPCQLVFDDGQLFLYAADSKNYKDIRLFNVCKIRNLTVLRNSKFELPPNYRFHEDFECGRWGAFQYDETYSYKIEFYGEARITIKERLWADDQQLIQDEKNDKTIMTFTSSQWIPIEHWLLSFGENAKPIEPDWFVADWQASIKKMYENSLQKE